MAQIQRLKKATTVLATFLVALTIGFVMQYGDADAARVVFDGETASGPAFLEQAPVTRASASTMDNALGFDLGAIKFAALVKETDVADPSIAEALDCPITLAAQPAQNAMINLSIHSSCRANMNLTVHHAGLIVSAQASADGSAGLTLPALQEDAVYQAIFADGSQSDISVRVPEARDY